MDSNCEATDITLSYTIDDDGVHLFCNNCGWDKNLGFGADVLDVAEAAATHL